MTLKSKNIQSMQITIKEIQKFAKGHADWYFVNQYVFENFTLDQVPGMDDFASL